MSFDSKYGDSTQTPTNGLTSDCYKTFIALKVHKRTEPYRRPIEPRPRALIPLSLGVSSSVLLRLLDGQVQRQRAKPFGKVSFDLHVLVIDPSSIAPSSASVDDKYAAMLKEFPNNGHIRLSFHDIFDYIPDIKEIMHQYAGPQFADDSSLSNQDRLTAGQTSAE